MIIFTVNAQGDDIKVDDPKEAPQILEEHKVTEEMMDDYKAHMLYDTLLSDWFSQNPASRFSMDDLGEVEIVKRPLAEVAN